MGTTHTTIHRKHPLPQEGSINHQGSLPSGPNPILTATIRQEVQKPEVPHLQVQEQLLSEKQSASWTDLHNLNPNSVIEHYRLLLALLWTYFSNWVLQWSLVFLAVFFFSLSCWINVWFMHSWCSCSSVNLLQARIFIVPMHMTINFTWLIIFWSFKQIIILPLPRTIPISHRFSRCNTLPY